ncbi:acyl-CoA dehydrogenase family protein [Flavonifractor sp. DFI.6.63]|uniref:acyl-CoA dehydrogenase family protein n=1 Tax=Flavonifractor sp. DFI.6.63 TaxID=2963704 RepID=UPI002108F97A|nr:acyl-CoA dehydrogenase family protein [Flavonifractor sp. DFI.6.63]MCQ5030966.1 acyl-CoA dehydrogenase family protein [Flavonifractor sp. DFI.6.63]
MFEVTKQQEMLITMVREFSEKEIAPLAEELDCTGKFPAETTRKMTALGLLGLNVPKKYGGVGLTEVDKVLCIIEVARACSSTAEMFAVQLLVNGIITNYGTEEQKKKYLGMTCCEGKLGAFALTEPGAGSDAGGLQTTATEDGDSYILNGSKCFISNLGPTEGEYAIVIALTDKVKKTHGGMTAFLVDRDTPGFIVGKLEDKMGIRGAAVSELILEECRVPKNQVLGKVGKGFHIAMSGLDSGRVGIAAQACGEAQAALDAAIEYSKQRSQFGRPIAAKQGLQWYLAEMATRLEAAKLLTLKAADLRDRKLPAAMNASMAKFFAAETANEIAAKAVQIHGGYGYMKDYAIERIYRDARILTIYEGTSEVQKIVISKELLK